MAPTYAAPSPSPGANHPCITSVTLRRLVLGAVLTGAAHRRRPSGGERRLVVRLPPQRSTELNVTDGSGAQPAADRPRERRQPLSSPSTTASARRIFCSGALGSFAQVDNTDQIDISGPITHHDRRLRHRRVRRTPRPRGHAGAQRRLRDRDRGVHHRRRARLAERARRHRSRTSTGWQRPAWSTAAVTATPTTASRPVRTRSGSSEPAVATRSRGPASAPLGPATTRVVLDGGGDADMLVGGHAQRPVPRRQRRGHHARRRQQLDVISGGPDFDTAFVDQVFDVFIDGVEDIRKVTERRAAAARPARAEGRGRHDLAAEGRLEAPAGLARAA